MDRAERHSVPEQVLLAVEVVVGPRRVVDEEEREVAVKPRVSDLAPDLLTRIVRVTSGATRHRLVVRKNVGEAGYRAEAVALTTVSKIPLRDPQQRAQLVEFT